jgi:predicted RNA binding protein YcfA (HicA-like mRNA interferase family)
MTIKNPKVLLHITWKIAPDRVPKGSYQKIQHPEPNRVTCTVHDEEDKQQFMRDIARVMRTARPGNIR